MESRQGVTRGDRLWQLSFGSGFKCNSAVWTALRDCNDQVRPSGRDARALRLIDLCGVVRSKPWHVADCSSMVDLRRFNLMSCDVNAVMACCVQHDAWTATPSID